MIERIVCLVVADEQGVHSAIDGPELTETIRRTLDAYEFTESGIEHFMQVLLGNDVIPIKFQEEQCGTSQSQSR
jgi:hypothetical protein